MYNKKFLLPTDYGANYKSTLKIGAKQPSPMNPEINKRIASFNCYGLGCSREYVAELVKQNSFSLSSIDVTNGIKAERPYGGITFIWHRDFGCNIQVKR